MPSRVQNTRLRVFEAFAGIGAQTTALKRLGIDYEVVGISDWFIDAINGDLSIEMLKVLIEKSYELTKPKLKEITNKLFVMIKGNIYDG